MKARTLLLIVSLGANLALSGWRLLGPARGTPGSTPPKASAPARVTADRRAEPSAATAEAAIAPADATALRDQLHALGFSAAMVRAAVRAYIEAPRLAREREFRAIVGMQPWWQAYAYPYLYRPSFTAAQNRELRGLRQAERAEIERVLGPAGNATPADLERYFYLPEEKAARLALLMSDYAEARNQVATEPTAPTTRAEIAERDKLRKADYDSALAALLTPAEREQFELRTSNAAHGIGRVADYFSGTEAEYRAIYDLQKTYMEQDEARRATPLESQGRSGIEASQKLQKDMQAALGDERYRQWQRAYQEDYTALVELQRRFAVPQDKVDAVAAVVRQISDEGMHIARDDTAIPREQKAVAVRALADDARNRVLAILGADLGEAYNTASARAWLDHLERGNVPFIQANGQRAIFGVSLGFSNQRLPPPASKAGTPAPKR